MRFETYGMIMSSGVHPAMASFYMLPSLPRILESYVFLYGVRVLILQVVLLPGPRSGHPRISGVRAPVPTESPERVFRVPSPSPKSQAPRGASGEGSEVHFRETHGRFTVCRLSNYVFEGHQLAAQILNFLF